MIALFLVVTFPRQGNKDKRGEMRRCKPSQGKCAVGKFRQRKCLIDLLNSPTLAEWFLKSRQASLEPTTQNTNGNVYAHNRRQYRNIN